MAKNEIELIMMRARVTNNYGGALRKFSAWRLLIKVNNATLRCQDGGSRAVFDIEFGENTSDMPLHGFLTDEEGKSNVFIA